LKYPLCGLLYFTCLIPLYGYAYFSPTIINGWNFSPIETQLRGVPPWALAGVVATVVAYASGRARSRYTYIVLLLIPSFVGFMMLLVGRDLPTAAKYGALFLAITGVFTATPITICWFETNVTGHDKRAVAIPFQIGFGNAGGLAATFLFLGNQAPAYTAGYAVCVASLILCFFAATTYFFVLRSHNRKVESEDTAERNFKCML